MSSQESITQIGLKARTDPYDAQLRRRNSQI
ncbi:hypothetical protein FOMG_18926 [Fusarium oxysporum f. sp. melonis 26406]|uniref:Uncharacterized protein n=1 Tax=Fusarium oxysporum f. sp. melonis 26406 TaxID=1089452 RepID=W9YYU7_FUSOX|nr:hypothetical protein FOMG_18926 [Fusarium oxysporum f. sp. melonis 26406]